MKFLLDASSTLQLIRSLDNDTTFRVLGESCVLDLGKYEVGNALWKEHVLRRAITEDEFHEFFKLLANVLQHSTILSVENQNLGDVAKIAASEKITFYDASYIEAARGHRLTLITEDAKLAKAAAKYTKTTTTNDLQRDK